MGTSVSNHIKANLTAVEIQNEKVSNNIYFDFYSVTRFTKRWLLFSRNPPPRILSFIQLFLTGVNQTKSATSLSDLVTHGTKTSLLELGQTMC